MVSIPKVVGVLSCGMLLCLGLSNVLLAGEMKGDQDSKKGDHAGRKGDQDKLKKDDINPDRSAGKAGKLA